MTIGKLNISENDCNDAFENDKYIATYNKIYQVMYCTASRMYYYQQLIDRYYYDGCKPFAKRGTYRIITGQEVNAIIGHNILIESKIA